jgi:tripartite-type tricarboxylate transporter receptor subunit TctC
MTARRSCGRSQGTSMTRIIALCVAFAMSCLAPFASAQDVAGPYPRTTIQIVNPYAAGGPVDGFLRPLAAAMGDVLKQQVVVINKPGAGSAIGASFVARAEPDGYTLLLSAATAHAVIPVLTPKVGYDGLSSFTFISMVTIIPNAMVARGGLPVKTVADVVALAKANPGKFTFGSAGVGSQPHIAGELFGQMTRTNIVHVPYTGAAPATTDLLSGQIDLAFLNAPALIQHIQSGALRGLAVTTLRRARELPELPTLDELGLKGFDVASWFGISGPAGMPRPVVDKLAAVIAQVLATPALRQRIEAQGTEIFVLGPDAFAAYLRQDAERMARIVRAANIRSE